MMERKTLMMCSVVGFLGLLSAATGFGAEATRIKGSQVQSPSPSECIYPHSPAMALGLTAALALMIAQIIINVSTGCICCQKSPHPSDSNWKVALVCFVFSWFAFVIAFLLLLTGAALNNQHSEVMYFGNYYCYVVKPGVFAGVPNRGGIAMGQPQFPPQSTQEPVFVHEDTYIRRQFT
ncbi:hypothetical protein CIPAW_06G020100 [Carya illinoinensis]|uniref:Uncharacterized protein n=1 Tax=Carya illinoinensis TaxID=32201 RepID=A0A8T1Q6X3_CARIL|nr:hypothetical protein CIPAW_06G020100 [Carya illinoinensis]